MYGAAEEFCKKNGWKPRPFTIADEAWTYLWSKNVCYECCDKPEFLISYRNKEEVLGTDHVSVYCYRESAVFMSSMFDFIECLEDVISDVSRSGNLYEEKKTFIISELKGIIGDFAMSLVHEK